MARRLQVCGHSGLYSKILTQNKSITIQEQVVASNILHKPKLWACAEFMALLYWLCQFSSVIKSGFAWLFTRNLVLTWAEWMRAARGDGVGMDGSSQGKGSVSLLLLTLLVAVKLWETSLKTFVPSRSSHPVSGSQHPLPWSCLTQMKRSPLKRHVLLRSPTNVSISLLRLFPL